MGDLLAIVVYVLCIMMFFVKREQKVAILFVYAICFSSVFVRYSLVINPVVFFYLSEIRYIRQYLQAPRKYNLQFFIGVILISSLLLILNSPHLRSVKELLSYTKAELLYKYLLLFVPLVVMTKARQKMSFITPIFLSLLLLTFFGVLNLLFQHADFVDWAMEGQDLNSVMEDAGDKFADSERFRVQAMHFNPFDYGFICVALMLLFYYLRKKRLLNPLIFWVSMSCCLFGIVSCGCRTILLCMVLGFFCIYVMTHKLKRTICMVALFLTVLVIGYLNVPYITEKLDTKLFSIFDKHSDVGGSSITMRTYQLMAVLARISDHFYLGMGYKYFSIDLGWQDGPEGLIDEDLYGLEGIYLNLLLERGALGLLLYLLFMLILMKIFLSYRKSDLDTSTFGSSLCVVYLAFAFMTGELNSAFITFLLLGIGMKFYSFNLLSKKNCSIQKKNEILNNHTSIQKEVSV